MTDMTNEQRQCTANRCDRIHYGKGFCKKHYARFARTGQTDKLPMPTLQERFDDKYIIVPESGCWIWTAGVTDVGYGTFYNGKKNVLAHRHSYIQKHG